MFLVFTAVEKKKIDFDPQPLVHLYDMFKL